MVQSSISTSCPSRSCPDDPVTASPQSPDNARPTGSTILNTLIPSLETGGLILAYGLLTLLLLALNLHSAWNVWVKLVTNVLFIGLCVVTWHAWPGVLGWPTERDLPTTFVLHAVQVEEPNRIYLWGTDLDRGMGRTVPRAFALTYSPELHDRVDKASRKLRKGLPVVGQVSQNTGTPEDLSSIEQVRTTQQDVTFIDAPQGLVPGKN